jgi:cytochrome c556
MSKFGLAICAAVLSSLVTAASRSHEHHDHSKVTGVVRERMDAMAEMGRRMKSITKRVRSKDMLAAVPEDAKVVKDLAAKIIPLFPQGSMQPPTEATPEIWKNFGDFESKSKALEREAAKLSEMKSVDAKALATQAAAVRETCSGCHERYRIRQ